MMSKSFFFSISLFFSVISVRGQDTIAPLLRHRIGINVSKIILLSKSSSGQYDLQYQFSINRKSNIRLGGSYDQVSGDEGKLDFSFRIGYSRFFKQSNKWFFYWGTDGLYKYVLLNNDKRNKKTMGIAPFLGVMFKISPNVSFATEPSFEFIRIRDEDPESFTNKVNTWEEYHLGNIGQVLINFHF